MKLYVSSDVAFILLYQESRDTLKIFQFVQNTGRQREHISTQYFSKQILFNE